MLRVRLGDCQSSAMNQFQSVSRYCRRVSPKLVDVSEICRARRRSSVAEADREEVEPLVEVVPAVAPPSCRSPSRWWRRYSPHAGEVVPT
jgi:hypothetical protein